MINEMMETLSANGAPYKPGYTDLLPLQRFVAHEPAGRYGISELLDRHLARKVLLVRGQHVLLDRDLAILHGVPRKRIKALVRAGAAHFEEGSVLPLTPEELMAARSHMGVAASVAKAPVHAFTELGILTVGLLLRTPRAMAFNLRIIRLFLRMCDVLTTNQDILFTRMREVPLSSHDVVVKLKELEGRITGHDEEIQAIFDHLTELVSPTDQARKPIGVKPEGS